MLPEIMNKIFLYLQSPTNKIMKEYIYRKIREK